MRISINANRCEPSPMRKFHPLAVATQKQGKRIYHLNIGQPDLPTPQAYYDAVRSCDHKTLAYAESPGMPKLIHMRTVKGKGVSYMENQVGWHGKAPNAEQRDQALAELVD